MGLNLLARREKDEGHRISLYLELIDSLQTLGRTVGGEYRLVYNIRSERGGYGNVGSTQSMERNRTRRTTDHHECTITRGEGRCRCCPGHSIDCESQREEREYDNRLIDRSRQINRIIKQRE